MPAQRLPDSDQPANQTTVPPHASDPPRRIALTGSGGLIGTALTQHLEQRGDEVVAVHRNAKGKFDADEVRDRITGCHAVVHLAGEPVFGRWSRRKMQAIMDSRVDGTRAVAEACVASRVRHLISASGIGYYGHHGGAVMDESESSGSDFLAAVCVAWEDATTHAKERGVRVAHPRIGPVLSDQGGALKLMLPIFKLGLGGRVGNGNQQMSWISLTDMVRGLVFLLDHRTLAGPFNFTAPKPVSNAEFTRTLAAHLHRPAILPAPAFALRLRFGRLADEALLDGRAVVPRALQDAGFTFEHPSLDQAFAAEIA